ncbi:hypothetical protein EV2_018444 [Malus domestica]
MCWVWVCLGSLCLRLWPSRTKRCNLEMSRIRELTREETQVGEAAATCNPMELGPCVTAIMSLNSPTAVCCGKLKEQSPCLYQYVKNPNLQKLVNSSNAKKVADTCGCPFPTCKA